MVFITILALLTVGLASPAAHSQVFTSLYSFNGSDGANLVAPVMQGQDGSLYGTTSVGGAHKVGTVFKMKTDGTGFQSLYSFSSGHEVATKAAVIQGRDGFLYGTTSFGGTHDLGTVFKMKTDGTGFRSLYNFSGRDGASPQAAMIQGLDGFLYGTTSFGGINNLGTVFKIKTDGTGFRSLYTLSNSGLEGTGPQAAMIQGRDGFLYGTTSFGSIHNLGTVFKIKTDGTGFRSLYSFIESNERYPRVAVVQGQDGFLYGTTFGGGTHKVGTVFRMKTDGTDFRSLYSFSDRDGTGPQSALIQGRDGLLYGTTSIGGAHKVGTVFRIKTDGTGFRSLYSFSDRDGTGPQSALIQGRDGLLYGTTSIGGAHNVGTAFKMKTDGTKG
jgi:uncharacterized repeat protein (TIGR03803 family)